MARPYTKDLIKREFLALLEEKSFHSITIAMLAKRCDISRNTFYYHYDDVYSLVKEIFADELVKAGTLWPRELCILLRCNGSGVFTLFSLRVPSFNPSFPGEGKGRYDFMTYPDEGRES